MHNNTIDQNGQAPANNQPHGEQQYQQQFQSIDDPQRVLSLLKPAIENETSLKIAANRGDELFQTDLLDIDFSRKVLYLKKIAYTYGHFMVIDAKYLTVYSQHDGAQVSFRTYLIRYSERNGGYYEVRFPEQVKYCQRRMSHRVHLSFAHNVKAEFYDDTGEKIQAHLRDISADGVRLQLPEVNPNNLHTKSLIKNCIINFPGSEQIHCNLQIQHKYNHLRKKGCTIGGAFYAMSAKQKKEVQKLIAGLERRLLREVRI
jgi:c-di-GMP-binding flagellar brake protein YcgR